MWIREWEGGGRSGGGAAVEAASPVRLDDGGGLDLGRLHTLHLRCTAGARGCVSTAGGAGAVAVAVAAWRGGGGSWRGGAERLAWGSPSRASLTTAMARCSAAMSSWIPLGIDAMTVQSSLSSPSAAAPSTLRSSIWRCSAKRDRWPAADLISRSDLPVCYRYRTATRSNAVATRPVALRRRLRDGPPSYFIPLGTPFGSCSYPFRKLPVPQVQERSQLAVDRTASHNSATTSLQIRRAGPPLQATLARTKLGHSRGPGARCARWPRSSCWYVRRGRFNCCRPPRRRPAASNPHFNL